MSIKKSYNEWASQYDSNQNKTRDLEAFALREILSNNSFKSCLEIGCGTGKNTEWLQYKTINLTAVDFSEGMLAKAKEKIQARHVQFVQADISTSWIFAKPVFYDLIIFSLVLEHIEMLDHVFREAANASKPGAFLYIGELHPYKQYMGSKAKFETDQGTHELKCFTHQVSDFLTTCMKHKFLLKKIKEYSDNEGEPPRILAMLFQKHE